MNKKMFFNNIKDNLKNSFKMFDDIMFTNYKCVICGRESEHTETMLCNKCLADFKFIDGNICKRCGLPLVGDGSVCEDCRHIDFQFDSARSCFVYAGDRVKLITNLKFRNKKYLAKFLAMCANKTLCDWAVDFDYFVSVPTSKESLEKRGYNHAELIANELSLIFGKPVLTDIVMRDKTAIQQKELNRADRVKNLRGVFKLTDKAKEYKGLRFMIVDDVFTTGATINEVAITLNKLSPLKVYAITPARTLLHKDSINNDIK